MSFKYIKKSKGPSMLPCGMPDIIALIFEAPELLLLYCLWFNRCELISGAASPQMPY